MFNKWVKRISRALLPCFVFFVFSFSFAPKAYAAEVSGNVTYGYQYTSGGTTVYGNRTVTGSLPIVQQSTEALNLGSRTQYADVYIWLDGNIVFDGPVKLYASYYSIGTPSANYLDPSGFTVRYTNSNSNTGYVNGGLDSIDEFTVDGSTRKGYAIEASWQGSEGLPIRALGVYRTAITDGFTTSGNVTMTFPSIRFISSAYSAELDALDNLASEIAAQSDLLLAMKGDIVAILQDIYTMTGDMYIAQNLLNGYVSQMLPLLQNINSNTASIYSLLSTQLRLLETAIENAADSIEAAIAAQTAAMIAYLEQYFNTGNEVPDDTYQQQQDAENILDQMGSLEKPDVNTIVPVIGDYTDGGVSGVLGAIFSSNLIVTMMTLSASFAFGAYVLFGKRD